MQIAVVLVRPKGPVNVGLTARACANMGVTDLRLVQPQCDIQSLACRQFAHHAQALLKQATAWESLDAALADSHWAIGTSARRRRSGWPRPHSVAVVQQSIRERQPQRLALVFGCEAHGLSQSEALACQQLLYLPAHTLYPSYNLSHAVVLTLFSLSSTPLPSIEDHHPLPMASRATKQRLLQVWQQALAASGYFERITEEKLAPKLSQLVQRLQISQTEANILFSMVSHFARKKNAPKRAEPTAGDQESDASPETKEAE